VLLLQSKDSSTGGFVPRYIIVHSATPNIFAPSSEAHCFGPFDSFEDAELFEESTPKDTCLHVALEIVGPDLNDIVETMPDDDETTELLREAIHQHSHHSPLVH
jgi:hypothetical protein